MNKMMLKLPTSFGEAVKQVFVGTSALSLPTREMGASSSPHYIGHDPIWGQCNRHRTAEVFRPAQDGCSISAIIKKTFEVHFAKYRRRWRSDPRSNHLRGAGFTVVTAAGGREGLKRAEELHPIAITLDVLMPDIDGWTVLAALRGNPELADIPVVMATVTDDPQHKGMTLGAAGFLTKPIDRDR